VVEHSPRHPKVDGLSPAVAAVSRIEKIRGEIYLKMTMASTHAVTTLAYHGVI
jgi:hypothetical protein